MTEVAEVLYLAKSRTTGRWEQGSARRLDGQIEIRQSTLDRDGFSADPEQLFAAGWTTSFDGTMARAALKMKAILSESTSIDATVDLYLVDGGYFLRARLDASLLDIPPEIARILAGMAEQRGSSPKTIRGHIDVTIDMV
jgi:organic hydroperoxide reductase OsmC/OhrA